MRGDATSSAAGGGVQRLQFSDDFLQLAGQLRVSAGAELRPEVFKAIDGNRFPRLNQTGTMSNAEDSRFKKTPLDLLETTNV